MRLHHFQVTSSLCVPQRPPTSPLVFAHSFPFRFSTSLSVSPSLLFQIPPHPRTKCPSSGKDHFLTGGGEVLGTEGHGVSHVPPSSASPRRRQKTRPLRQRSSQRCLQGPRGQGWGTRIHPADEYFTWGEGGAPGSVEDFMKERVLKRGVCVERKQKSQGQGPAQSDFKPKRKDTRPETATSGFSGAEGRVLAC